MIMMNNIVLSPSCVFLFMLPHFILHPPWSGSGAVGSGDYCCVIKIKKLRHKGLRGQVRVGLLTFCLGNEDCLRCLFWIRAEVRRRAQVVPPHQVSRVPPCVRCLWDGHCRLPWLFPGSWKRQAAALEGPFPSLFKAVSTSGASSSSSVGSHVRSSATAPVNNITAEQAAWPIQCPDAWGITDNGIIVGCPLGCWLTYQATWKTLTNMKHQGEVSSVGGGMIRNYVNSLFSSIEALFALGLWLLEMIQQEGGKLVMMLSCSWVMVMHWVKIRLRIDVSLGQGW